MEFKYEKNFSVVLDKINGNMEGTLKEIGKTITGESQSRSPVDTGRLRRETSYETRDGEVLIGTNVEYAENVHNGTSKQRAQPYIQDAVMSNMDVIRDIAKKFNSRV